MCRDVLFTSRKPNRETHRSLSKAEEQPELKPDSCDSTSVEFVLAAAAAAAAIPNPTGERTPWTESKGGKTVVPRRLQSLTLAAEMSEGGYAGAALIQFAGERSSRVGPSRLACRA